MKRIFLILFATVATAVVCACASNKMPDWVINSPRDAAYYHGVGYALKEKKSMEHVAAAQNAALRSLASEISVAIEATTLLIQYEDDKTLKDNFTSVINARVESELEGCELVDTYETRKEYWVYYRLSKQQYAEQQARKRQAAADVALSLFDQAIKAERENNYYTAIVQYTKTLDALKSYFNERIMVDYEGESFNIVSETYNHINNILTHIDIEVNSLIVGVKQGSVMNNVYCTVTNCEQPIANMPVLVEYSERAQKKQCSSDAQGRVVAGFNVKSQHTTEVVEFKIDFDRILLETSADYSIRKWLLQTPVVTRAVTVIIEKPAIYIDSKELNFGKSYEQQPVKTLLSYLFEKNDYTVVDSLEKADYVVTVDVNTSSKNQWGSIYVAGLQMKLNVRDLTLNKLVYSQLNNDVSALQLSYEKAGQEAYEDLLDLINDKYFAEIKRAISAKR